MLKTAMTPELYCTNLRISLNFYTQVLGFSIQYERPESGFVMLERQGVRLMLDEIGQGRVWLAGPLEAPFGRGVNLQIKTEQVDDLYAAVQKAGAKIFMAMEEKWYRANDIYVGNRQFIVQDPDGYMLRFFEDLGERSIPA